MALRALAAVAIVSFCAGAGIAQSNPPVAAMDRYLQPYVHGNNFAGELLGERNGNIIFEGSYGLADREQHIRNTPATRFHVASVSMQFDSRDPLLESAGRATTRSQP